MKTTFLPKCSVNENINKTLDLILDVESSSKEQLEGIEQINQAVNNFNDLNGDWFNKKQVEYINSTVTSVKLLNNDFRVGNNTALNRFRTDKDYEFTSWNKEAIDKRQKILLDLVYETWQFNDKRIDI